MGIHSFSICLILCSPFPATQQQAVKPFKRTAKKQNGFFLGLKKSGVAHKLSIKTLLFFPNLDVDFLKFYLGFVLILLISMINCQCKKEYSKLFMR